MPWGSAIFLTLLLIAIGWPLLRSSPPKTEEERSVLVMEFAETLKDHPEWVKIDPPRSVRDARASPSENEIHPRNTGPGVRTLWSAQKSPPIHPHPETEEGFSLHLKSSQNPLVFESKNDFQKWVHEEIGRNGAGIIGQIAIDRDFNGFIVVLSFIQQSERNPVVLQEVNRQTIEVASRILLDQRSPHHDSMVAILESILRQDPGGTEAKEVENLLLEYRSRP